jgi:hypothetical protein
MIVVTSAACITGGCIVIGRFVSIVRALWELLINAILILEEVAWSTIFAERRIRIRRTYDRLQLFFGLLMIYGRDSSRKTTLAYRRSHRVPSTFTQGVQATASLLLNRFKVLLHPWFIDPGPKILASRAQLLCTHVGAQDVCTVVGILLDCGRICPVNIQ